jgi:hypothetical protein
MDWLAVAVLGIIWGVLLLPAPARREASSPLRRIAPIEEQEFRNPGRWIVSPRRGARFLGRQHRARLRARERRRRVFLFLLEVIGVTGLIGMFPPLRGMLVVTAVLAVFLAAYAGMVVWMTRKRPAGVEASPETDRVFLLPAPDPESVLAAQDSRVVRVGVR